MKQNGVTPSGLPVYSEDDPRDFLWRWLRIAWPHVLCGRFFDQTGDTFGYWVCAVTGVDCPAFAPSVAPLCGEWSMSVVTHTENEDSGLSPDTVFRLERNVWTFVFEADVGGCANGHWVRAFRIRRTTREGEAAAIRWGGDFGFYEWRPEP